MALKAIAFRIVVKPDPIEKTSAGGIILAMDERQERAATTRGTIVDIGEDAWSAYRVKSQFAGLKIGDRIYFARYAGKMIKETDDGPEFIVLNDEDVVCKIEEA